MSKEIFLIDNFRLANCQNLGAALQIWNDAEFGRKCLEDKKLLALVKEIKDRTNWLVPHSGRTLATEPFIKGKTQSITSWTFTTQMSQKCI